MRAQSVNTDSGERSKLADIYRDGMMYGGRRIGGARTIPNGGRAYDQS